MSIPVSYPISWSIETRSSVATLPVAPFGTGQPPSSPNEDSNECTPTSRAASAFASPWPRVLGTGAGGPVAARWGEVRGDLDVTGPVEPRREELAHLHRIGHPRGVAERDLRT